MRITRAVVGLGAFAFGLGALATASAGAVTNTATTRDCSLLVPAIAGVFGGLDPDFIELSGVSVSGNVISAQGSQIALKASESPVPADQMAHVAATATITPPTGAATTVTGGGTGSVVLALPLTGGSGKYVISWSATFDNGAHPCPGVLTPANLLPTPFTVQSA